MDNVSLGVIGCGVMARDLARRCVRLGRVRIAAVYDSDPDIAASAGVELVAEPVFDVGELCNRIDIDAVIIASPPGAHLEAVLAAAAAGKAVFCEKPLGISVAECDRMIAACRNAGVPLFVGHVLRLFPLFRHSIRLCRDSVIGKVRGVAITRTGYSTEFHSGWRSGRAMAGGLLYEVHVHEFDYMRALLGRPTRVTARLDDAYRKMEYEDTAYVMVEFEGGGTGLLHASNSSPIGEYNVHIHGSEGNMVHGGFGGNLRYQTIHGVATEVSLSEIGGQNPYDRELGSWIDSLTIGLEPLFTGEDGRMAVAMAECAYRSAGSGKPVSISEVLTPSDLSQRCPGTTEARTPRLPS